VPVPLPLPALGCGAALLAAADGVGTLTLTLAEGDGTAADGFAELVAVGDGDVVDASEPLPVEVGVGVGVLEDVEPVSPPIVEDELPLPVSDEIDLFVSASKPVIAAMASAKTRTAAPMRAGHLRPRRPPTVSQPRRQRLGVASSVGRVRRRRGSGRSRTAVDEVARPGRVVLPASPARAVRRFSRARRNWFDVRFIDEL
jgi:hypothetical protein